MKRLLTVQDISCVGKCSATVALPIISAMGVETALLPTAVLSTHTAFPSPAVQDLTAGIGPILAHWQQMGITFDGISTGYLGAVEQVSQVLALVEKFYTPDSLLVVDPVMGDNGKLYSRVDRAFTEEMGKLCAKADVILPNLTEACFLTNTPYREAYDETDIKRLLHSLSEMGCGICLITGVSLDGETTGVVGYERTSGAYFRYFHEKLPKSYHGTGDIFASTLAGAMLLGRGWKTAVQIAADYTVQCIRMTMDEPRGREYGVNFEHAIPYLLEMIK